MHTHIYIYIRAYIHIRIDISVCKHKHRPVKQSLPFESLKIMVREERLFQTVYEYIHIHIHTHIYTCIHIDISIYIYAHTHTRRAVKQSLRIESPKPRVSHFKETLLSLTQVCLTSESISLLTSLSLP